MAQLTLTALSKSFGDSSILNAITLSIDDGEFVVLVGPSGCGKSTLLRCIAGLESITSGELFIDGTCVNALSPKDRDIAMVFQSYALYPHMTVRDNMSFGLKIRRFDKHEIRERLDEAAALLELEGLLDRYPKQLSGGQRQRVAMGRAIVRRPKVFLFDEPLSNLDAALRVQMRAELSRLHRRLGTTMIYVTHDQTEAMTLAQKIVVLNRGVVQQIAKPLDVYIHPANRFVASFIGSPSMNFIAVNQFDDSVRNVASLNDNTEIGIRPEHLSVTGSNAVDPRQIQLKGTVDVVELVGHEAFLYVTLSNSHSSNDAAPVIVARVSSESVMSLQPGNAITLATSIDRLYRFDTKTGDAIQG